MKIYLFDQTPYFDKHLEQLKTASVMPYKKEALQSNVHSIQITNSRPFHELSLETILDYHIFPKHIMTHCCEWKKQQRVMQVGDTIVQQIYIPPTPTFSQKIIAGVRISEITQTNDRISFSYETLEGHVEKGISTFSLTVEPDGSLMFSIKTYSRPGNFLSMILAPFFSIPYQKYCTLEALKNVKALLS